MQHIRTFFAIKASSQVVNAATAIIDHLKQQPNGNLMTWSRGFNLHITLRFLGSIDSELVPTLTQKVANAIQSLKCFEIEYSNVIYFPPEKHRLYVVHVPLNQALADLANAINKISLEFGFNPEGHPFTPHLTIGRIKKGIKLPIDNIPITLPKAQIVDEVVLYQSEQTETGSIYTPIWTMPLQRAKL